MILFDERVFRFQDNSIQMRFYLYLLGQEYNLRSDKNHKLGEIYLSARKVINELGTPKSTARDLINKFTKLDIIRLVEVSEGGSESNKYILSVYEEVNNERD